jgi:hypothetical protein
MAPPRDVVDLTGDSDADDDEIEIVETRKRKVPGESPSTKKKTLHVPLESPEGSDDDDGEMHHPGELEVDWDGDFWADHDENCHGPIDTNSNRRGMPEGFVWTCCDKPGDACGCEKGEGNDLNARYPDSEPPSDDEGHPGELEVDWNGDFWADHDENCHGPIDTNTHRREFPEGFIWSCCEKPGDASGCEKSDN